MTSKLLNPDYLFEVSWEVCNKVGGIHTVISTKALTLVNQMGNSFMLIGPDVYRDTRVNPEFSEEPDLFKDWKLSLQEQGIRVRIGRWNIAGHPVAIIVDFSSFINRKDEIFSRFWELYKLDSISGQWDYIEPALFGYAAGKVIESFIHFHNCYRDKVLAQFHEWMTGAGILYLKDVMPQVGTIFTTHATVVGRCLAGNGRPLYNNLSAYSPADVSREFNITSKQSLEELSAKHADAFTTVSEITGRECKQFLNKEVDIVTPNGFDDSFVPLGDQFETKRSEARAKLLNVARVLLETDLPDNSFLVANSGRYEFRNKGIDLVIEALGKINKSGSLNRPIVAFILIPASHFGPRKNLLRLLNGESKEALDGNYLTHNLHDMEYDPILNRFRAAGLANSVNDHVKVIFVPSYLNGDDGIFNMPYYDLLIGLDLTIFPSYYEPWGYTPLESVAFSVPTITTSVTGFGLWALKEVAEMGHGVYVIERTDQNDREVIDAIASNLHINYMLPDGGITEARKSAYEVSRLALWLNFIQYYYDAYKIALLHIEERADQILHQGPTQLTPHIIKRPAISEPTWNILTVQSHLPTKLAALDEVANNVWWSWNYEAEELFESIDPELWQEVNQNPVVLLEQTDLKRFRELEKNKVFMEQMEAVVNKFHDYMNVKPAPGSPKIAYFSMEFGLHHSIKTYSGGLGLLAGDYLKEASDCAIDMVGIGLLYRYGYFDQMLSVNGEQQANYTRQLFSQLPLQKVLDNKGEWININVVFPGRSVNARVWKIDVGRVPLYLLDTDIDTNHEPDRSITHVLYGGDLENRLKQELLLGIGGIRVLDAIGIAADVYHSNEGHSAFIGLERLRHLIVENKLSFEVAREIVRASAIFTTHTPVPAGHDAFPEELLRVYLPHYPERLRITWDELMGLGRFNPSDRNEKFSMSVLAANLCSEMNGVSKLHGAVSKDMFASLYKGYLPEENHIDYVTNGVHYATWTAKEWRQLYEPMFGDGFLADQSNMDYWKKIYELPDERIWHVKQSLRMKLVTSLKERFQSSWRSRHENPRNIVDITENLRDDVLTIGFARRFATYKRAWLLFSDLEKLTALVNDAERPVQFLFAGKAHPNDGGGQDLIKKIVQFSRRPEFLGKIIFIENYDIALAKKLVAGVDVWLNTPTRPLEASGTSGEKAVMNGTLHFSVLDGWWCEGYRPNAGWALSEKKTYDSNEFQDELDADTIYHIIEDEIIPAFYERNDKGVPEKWVSFMKNSIAGVAPRFTMKRMLDDYHNKFYHKLQSRYLSMVEDDFSLAKDIALWKKMVSRRWDKIEVISACIPETINPIIKVGEDYNCEVVLDLNKLLPEEVGVEFLLVSHVGDTKNLVLKQEFVYSKQTDGKAYYRLKISPTKPGAFNYGIRIFPKHRLLPHRQDLCLLKWI